MESRFNDDVTQERILTPIIVNDVIGGFLTEHCLAYSIIHFEDNVDAQYDGIDFIMTNNDNHSWNVDVKCQTNEYINHPTCTFSIELNYLKDDILKDGWFVSERNLTDFYLFAWIHKATLDSDGLIRSVDQIEMMELMFVRKQSVVEYLNQIGYSIEELKEEATKFRNDGEDKTLLLPSKNGRKRLKLFCSRHLAEKPVNVIIGKYNYEKMLGSKHLMYIKGFGIEEYKSDFSYGLE